MKEKLDPISEAIADIRAGKVVIVVDDANRENEGDFITAAENAFLSEPRHANMRLRNIQMKWLERKLLNFSKYLIAHDVEVLTTATHHGGAKAQRFFNQNYFWRRENAW